MSESLEIILNAVDNASKAIDSVRESVESIAAMDAGRAIAEVGRGLTDMVSRPIVAGLTAATNAAIEYESSLADVNKIFGKSESEAAGLGDAFLQMSRDIPISASGLAEIAAAGGQLGVGIDEIQQFTEVTAQMATAFDMSADQAGKSIAKLQTALSLDGIDEIAQVGDIFNHLSDNSGAAASEMVDVATRIGGTAKTFGLTTEQIGALSASFIELAPSPEIAATAINSILPALQTAEKGAPAFQDALQQIGFSASDMVQMIEQDAMGGLQTFIGALGELDSTTRAGVIADMFGTGSDAALINTLAGDASVLSDNLAIVGDQSAYAGSMMNEFSNRSDTTANQLQLARNSMTEIGIQIGAAVLPAVNELLNVLIPLAHGFAEFAAANPEIVKIGVAIAGVVAAAGPLLIIFGQIVTAIGAIQAAFAGGGVLATIGPAIAAAFGGIKAIIAGIIGGAVGLAAILGGVVFAVFRIGAAFAGVSFTVSEFFAVIKSSIMQLPANLAQIPAAIASVFSMMRTVAMFYLQGLLMQAQAIFNQLPSLAMSAIAAVGSAFSQLSARVQAAFAAARAAATAGVAGIVAAVRAGGAQAVAAVVAMGQQIIAAITNIVGMARAAAARIGQAIAAGLRSAIGAVQSAAGALGNAVRSALPGSPVKWGPLRVLNNIQSNPGAEIGNMIARGIESSAPLLQSAVGSIGGVGIQGLSTPGFGGGQSASILPSPTTTPAAASGGGVSGPVTINVNLGGVTGNAEEVGDSIREKIEEVFSDLGANNFRVSYG